MFSYTLITIHLHAIKIFMKLKFRHKNIFFRFKIAIICKNVKITKNYCFLVHRSQSICTRLKLIYEVFFEKGKLKIWHKIYIFRKILYKKLIKPLFSNDIGKIKFRE